MALYLLPALLSFVLVHLTVLTFGQLPSKDVIEQPCPDLPPIANPKDVDLNWFPQPQNFKYMPFASKHAYRLYAEIFLARAAKDEEEIDKMNYHSNFKDGIAENSGFGKEFRQVCAPVTQDPAKSPRNLYSFICITLGGNVNASAIVTSLDTLLWTDNMSAGLYTRCINGLVQDWTVWSPNPVLAPEVEKVILQKIEEVGFNRSYAEHLKYSDLGISHPGSGLLV